MDDRTPDGTPTVDLGPGEDRPEHVEASPTAATSAFDPPSRRFETVGELGRGGMGRVDDAFDRALGRPVAIKHMLSTSDVELARFEREARITARLEHPGIVPIHDAGRGPDGTPYYVMRRVDGRPLDAELGATLAERLVLIPNVLAACDAVAFAHARNIVHRDIKPTNILVGPFGETLVIDWGLAREIGEADSTSAILPSDPQLTRAGTVAGTPGFMSPEQARGESVDARADVFALGATLYFVLAGRLPYDTASATEMVGLAGAGRAPNWRAIPGDVPPELRAIAVKAMAADPAERYPDAGALAADLRRFITGNLVGAYDYGPLARFVRFVRRHRAAVAVAAVSALVVAAIAVVAVRRIVSERDDANAARALAEARQREAAASKDRLLVQHALELAASDPIATIAALRTLPVDSPRWDEARIAALAAFVQGIPFGFTGSAEYLQIERSGQRGAVLGRDGELAIIDLAGRTRRVVANLGRGSSALGWLGPHHIACGFSDRIAIVDLDHGTTRTIWIPVRMFSADHDSRVLIDTGDTGLFELTDPAGEPREVATNIEMIDVSRDLTQLLVRRGNRLEVWTKTGTHLTIPDAPKNPRSVVGAIGDDRVITLDAGVVRMWRIAGDKLVSEGTITNHLFVAVDVVGDHYMAFGPDGVTIVGDGHYRLSQPISGVPFRSPRGFAIVANGAVYLYDARGWVHLGSRASGLLRAEASEDGRFVLATTESGTVLAWDLGAVHPVRIVTNSSIAFERLTSTALWFEAMDEGLIRLDLATGTAEKRIDALLTGPTGVDPLDRFAIATHGDHLEIYDDTRKQQITVDGGSFDLDREGIVIGHPDGSLWRWRPGDTTPRWIAAFEGRPDGAISRQGDYFIAHIGDHVERIDLAGHRERAKVDELGALGVQSDGRAWLLEARALYIWDVGATPVKTPFSQHPDSIMIEGTTVIIYTHESITMFRGGRRYVASVASTRFTWDGGTTVALMTTGGEVMILDMASGLRFKLPVSGITNLAFYRDRVATGDNVAATLWSLDVPREPRELQTWLTTITNAKLLPGSEAYEWP